jgi:hypothetical protein
MKEDSLKKLSVYFGVPEENHWKSNYVSASTFFENKNGKIIILYNAQAQVYKLTNEVLYLYNVQVYKLTNEVIKSRLKY